MVELKAFLFQRNQLKPLIHSESPVFVSANVQVVLFYRETPACLMGKVSQLESMVKVLQDDLKKVSDGSVKMRAPHLENWSTCNIL